MVEVAQAAAAQTLKRERMLYGAIVAGVLWSFFYTAVSLLIMYGVARDSSETCEQFAASRDNVRALILTSDHPDVSPALIDELIPQITCD
jgi:hypothetical protein